MLVLARIKARGLGLLDAALALVLFGVIVLFVADFLDRQAFERRQAEVAEDLLILSRAAHSIVERDPVGFAAQISAAGGWLEWSLPDLKSAGVLAGAFAERNVLGQGYRVYYRTLSGGGIESLITTVTPKGRTLVYNTAGLRGYRGNNAIGIVFEDRADRLVGPGVNVDIRAFVERYRAPQVGEMALISTLNRETLPGSVLYRRAQPGRPELNRMETTLDLDRHDLEGAGTITGENLTLTGDLAVNGPVALSADLNVGRGLSVTGTSTFAKKLEAETATLSGGLSGPSLVAEELRGTAATVTGPLTAQRGSVSDSITSGQADLGQMNAGSLTTRTIMADEATLRDANATTVVSSGEITASEAAINHLYVGSCSGC